MSLRRRTSNDMVCFLSLCFANLPTPSCMQHAVLVLSKETRNLKTKVGNLDSSISRVTDSDSPTPKTSLLYSSGLLQSYGIQIGEDIHLVKKSIYSSAAKITQYITVILRDNFQIGSSSKHWSCILMNAIERGMACV